MLIIFEMCPEDEAYAERLSQLSEMSTGIVKPKSFSGVNELLQLGIVLTPAITSGVAVIISEMIKNKRSVDIKVGNVEVKGLTEDNALKILNQLLEKDDGELADE